MYLSIDFDERMTFIKNLPWDVGKSLKSHRKRRRITQEQLAELSQISVNTISDIETGKSKDPKLETILALIVGLDMPPIFSYDILYKSGHIAQLSLLSAMHDKKSMIFFEILSKAEFITIPECNEMLIVNKIEPLTDGKVK